MYDRDNDAERIFLDESRSKKRDGYGAMKRKATRGSSRKGIKFPSDYLTSKQKKQMNGEVIVSSIYKDISKIPSWDTIKDMEVEKAVALITTIKTLHSGSALQRNWGIRPATYYSFLEKIGLHTPKTKTNFAKKKDSAVYKDIKDVPSHDEYLDMDLGSRIELLKQLKKDVPMASLKKHWGISGGKLYDYLYKSGIISYGGKSDKRKKNIAKKYKGEEVLNEVDSTVGPITENEIVEEVIEEVVADEVIEEVNEQVHTIPVVYKGELINTIEVDTTDKKVEKIIDNCSDLFDLNIKSNNISKSELENRIFRALVSLDSSDDYYFELKIRRV